MTRGAIVTKAIPLLLGIALVLSGCVAEPGGTPTTDTHTIRSTATSVLMASGTAGTTGGITATGITAAGATVLPIADSAGMAASVGTVASAGTAAEVIAKPP
jgi:hypothetical protein